MSTNLQRVRKTAKKNAINHYKGYSKIKLKNQKKKVKAHRPTNDYLSALKKGVLDAIVVLEKRIEKNKKK